MGMAVGKVKWFNNAKGFGFINTDAREGHDEDGKDIDFFAHYSAIEMDGYKTLKAGQIVSFEILQGPKGLHAVKITSVTSPNEQSATAIRQETVSS
jgi:CspA family cold shock protein